MVDAKDWLEFMDAVGIETAVLYPTSALAYGKINSFNWAIAATRAYNDWLHETFLARTSRLKGMGLIPIRDTAAAVEELRRVVENLGMCGAMLPSNGLKAPLGDKEYWPIYQEAERLGCCLGIHGGCHDNFGLDHINVFAGLHALGHPFGLMISFTSMLFNGVFERFPNLKVGFLEGGVSWFLTCVERCERSYEGFRPYDAESALIHLETGEKVGAYIRKHIKAGRIFIGCEGDEPDLSHAVKVIGSEPFVFSSDFPHEVDYGTCRREIQELLENEELSETAKEGISYKNAERFYNLGVNP
jgi:predicted TIM-barrel fold metal-dependent hydrolase